MELNYTKPTEKVIAVFQKQIAHEYGNSALYKAIANYCEDRSLDKAAEFYNKQSDQERDHAKIFSQFLIDKKVTVDFPEVDKVVAKFDGLKDVLFKSLDREKLTTDNIKTLSSTCLKEQDLQGFSLSLKMLDEQVEEEALFINLIDKMNTLGNIEGYEYFLNKEF